MSEGTADLTLGPSPEVAQEDAPKMRRNVSVLAGAQLITWTMTLLWTLSCRARSGRRAWGRLVTAMAVTGIVSVVLGLGTRTYLVREAVVRPDSASEADRHGDRAACWSCRRCPRVRASPVRADRGLRPAPRRLVLYLVGGATILTLLAEPMQAGFQGIERMQYLAYSDVLNKSSLGLIGIAVVLVGFRAVGIAANMAAGRGGRRGPTTTLAPRRFFRIDLRTRFGQLASMTKHSFAYMGLRDVRDVLSLDRHGHVVADHDPRRGRRLVRRAHAALPDLDVHPGARVALRGYPG